MAIVVKLTSQFVYYFGGSMRLVRGLHNFSSDPVASVATIGTFDGLHLGHQRIIQRVVELAGEINASPTLILFEPQPAEFFSPNNAPTRLTRFREKITMLDKLGIEQVCCLHFTEELCGLSAESFIKQVLVDGLAVQHLVVGDDFRFGSGRDGDFSVLKEAGKRYQFECEDTPTTLFNDQRISSTYVRELLKAGDLSTAETLLGRPWSVTGHVSQGNQLGRTIGVPTANIKLQRRETPVRGVFAVNITLRGNVYHGVANVGFRPSVGDLLMPLLEVNIFDFNADIYGELVCVEFLHKIRNEKKFASFEALKQAIESDQAAARHFFEQGITKVEL